MPDTAATLKSRPTVVSVGGESEADYSLFGVESESFSVQVLPFVPPDGSTGQWEVIVMPTSKYQSMGGEVHGVVRSDARFDALHAALQVEQATRHFSQPLPHLPLRSSLLGNKVSAYCAELQAYVASLSSHPECHEAKPFVEFVTRSENESDPFASPVSPHDRRDAGAKGPTIARNPSNKFGTSQAGGAGSPLERERSDSGGAQPCTRVTISWVDESGEHVETLPVLTPTHGMGNRVIDVRALGAKTGFFTHDPGFTSTSSCVSAITYIDGENGVLLHRGYPIAPLATGCSFPEVAYLLIEGELPADAELDRFECELKAHWMVHEKLLSFYQGFRSDAHPMAIMVGVVGALSAFYPDSMDIFSDSQRRLSAVRLIAKMPTIAALAYKTAIGQPVIYPDNSLGFVENFLHMMFATPCAPYRVDPVHARALQTIFVLHADHEQNASTSTVRIASSSQANPFACIAAGIASLWGPAHGGANEAVLRMLDEIKTPDRIPLFLAKAKDKSDPFRLMGFGHRVYKNFDPRAQLMRGVCRDVLATVCKDGLTPELELAQKLEAAALADEYFAKRKLYPNVDFYSGIVLRALGIPRNMCARRALATRSALDALRAIARLKAAARPPPPRPSRAKHPPPPASRP